MSGYELLLCYFFILMGINLLLFFFRTGYVCSHSVKLLVDGSEIDQPDQQGRTPLHEVCAHGNVELLKVLLEYQPDLNIKDCNSETPLHFAVLSGNSIIVKLLLLAGIYISIYLSELCSFD